MLILQNGVKMSVFHYEIMEDSKTRERIQSLLSLTPLSKGGKGGWREVFQIPWNVRLEVRCWLMNWVHAIAFR